MKKRVSYGSLLPVYLLVLYGFLLLSLLGNRTATILSANALLNNRKTVIIDAGHGGVDGGATSCTGVLESQINLEIALKLNDFLHLLGIDTVMIRTTDCSVYTEGTTIAQKKVSDLKERARIINSTPNSIVVSIHQNHFYDDKYSGAQVFYAPTAGSQELAQNLQSSLIQCLNPESHRQIKKATGVYLMQHINSPAVLLECGFLSNPNEEYLLRSTVYQQRLCSVIGCTVSNYLSTLD